MRPVCCALGLAVLASSIALYAEPKFPCDETISRALKSRAVLIIDSRPAGIQVVGTDQEAIHVSCTAGNRENAGSVVLHFSPTANGGTLSIENTHAHHGNNNLEIKIEVPRRTNLRVRMFAGQVRVSGVKGDKDIALGAGQVTICSIHDGDYRSVNASVSIGEVQARAFGTDKGGFFRSFHRAGAAGDYRLEAHVTTGQIELLGNTGTTTNGPKPD